MHQYKPENNLEVYYRFIFWRDSWFFKKVRINNLAGDGSSEVYWNISVNHQRDGPVKPPLEM